MVISPGVQPLKEKVATTKKGITRVQQKVTKVIEKILELHLFKQRSTEPIR